MRLLLLTIISGCLAFSALTVSPTSCSFTQAQGGPGPFACKVEITGTGAWTATNTSSGPWMPFAWSASSGSGTKTIYLRADYTQDFTPGVYTSTAFTVAGTTITVTLTVVRAYPKPLFTNNMGAADADLGCTKSQTEDWRYNTCSSADARPGGTYDMPTLGNTKVDGVFGFTFRNIAPGGPTYTNRGAVNSDGTYFMGADGIYATATGVKTYNLPTPGQGRCFFSSTTANRIYCFPNTETTLTQWHFGSAPALVDDGTIWTAPHSDTFVNGGSDAASKDDWVCEYGKSDTGASYLYAINLADPTKYAEYNLQTLSPSMVYGDTGIDYCLMSAGKDTVSSKRYIWLGLYGYAQPNYAGRVFSVSNDTTTPTIDYEGAIANPEVPSATTDGPTWSAVCGTTQMTAGYQECVIGGHGSTGEAYGAQYLFLPIGRNFDYQGRYAAVRFRSVAGGTASISQEVGGGFQWVGEGANYITVARNRPYFLNTLVKESSVPASFTITACSGSSPVTCTTASDHGYSIGDSVLIGGAVGMTEVNGVNTISAKPAANQFSLNIATSGSYTASSAAVTKNTAFSGAAAGDEVWVTRLGEYVPGEAVAIQSVRLAKHRGVLFDAAYGYYQFPNIAPDGSLVVFQSNGGIPSGNLTTNSTYAIAPGLTAQYSYEFESGKAVTIATDNTAAVFTIAEPTGAPSISCTASSNRDLSSGTTQVAASGNPRYLTYTGLTLGTRYYWRCNSPDSKYVAVGSFVPTGSSTPTTVFNGWFSVSGFLQVN